MVLDRALIATPPELERIIVHELFHFVWVRLSNRLRESWSELPRAELAVRARGELGWSAEWRKQRLPKPPAASGRRWREYCCESFSDTAAWLYAADVQQSADHEEFTLASRYRARRRAWFEDLTENRPEGLPF